MHHEIQRKIQVTCLNPNTRKKCQNKRTYIYILKGVRITRKQLGEWFERMSKGKIYFQSISQSISESINQTLQLDKMTSLTVLNNNVEGEVEGRTRRVEGGKSSC